PRAGGDPRRGRAARGTRGDGPRRRGRATPRRRHLLVRAAECAGGPTPRAEARALLRHAAPGRPLPRPRRRDGRGPLVLARHGRGTGDTPERAEAPPTGAATPRGRRAEDGPHGAAWANTLASLLERVLEEGRVRQHPVQVPPQRRECRAEVQEGESAAQLAEAARMLLEEAGQNGQRDEFEAPEVDHQSFGRAT